jgi:Pyruvate/2-oxoacid:ferredoxin oxidoreductase delta subunit
MRKNKIRKHQENIRRMAISWDSREEMLQEDKYFNCANCW